MGKAKCGWLVGALLAASTPVSAATVCVNPAGGLCQTTIQAGVNAAGPGDLVKVAAGTYFETITVPGGKDGLQIVGAGKLVTVIDADVGNTDPAFFVFSNGVQLRNLGIRNGQATAIELAGNGGLVNGVRIVGPRGLGARGIRAFGSTGHQILFNEIRSVQSIGIDLGGGADDVVVQGNLVSQTTSGAISVVGANAQVVSNRIYGATSFGVTAFGAAPLVAGNLIEEVSSGYGLIVGGDNPVVRGNKLSRARTANVACAACGAGIVEGNSVAGSVVEGFAIVADTPGLSVRSNTVTNAGRVAFSISGTGVIATLNRASDSGVHIEGDCFRVEPGAGLHTFTQNVATRCGASGFYVGAPGVVLDRNVATSAGLNGFTIDGGANGVLTANTAQSSSAAGFAVTDAAATGTTLTGNLGMKNRYDFCDDGTGTDTSGGNTFGSTSTSCDVTE